MWPFKKKEIIYSTRKYSNYLPVGTIVRLNNSDEEYMIYRYMGNSCMAIYQGDDMLKKSYIYNSEEKNKKYYCVEYEIIHYPDSNLSNSLYIMHDDIKEIVYKGYTDEDRENVLCDIDIWNEK